MAVRVALNKLAATIDHHTEQQPDNATMLESIHMAETVAEGRRGRGRNRGRGGNGGRGGKTSLADAGYLKMDET